MILLFLHFWNMWRRLVLPLPHTPTLGHLADRCHVCGARYHESCDQGLHS